jgi:hypothetical protein
MVPIFFSSCELFSFVQSPIGYFLINFKDLRKKFSLFLIVSIKLTKLLTNKMRLPWGLGVYAGLVSFCIAMAKPLSCMDLVHFRRAYKS